MDNQLSTNTLPFTAQMSSVCQRYTMLCLRLLIRYHPASHFICLGLN